MNNDFSAVLERFSKATNTSVVERGEAKVLTADKYGVRFQVTIPNDVLEWFVDVFDGDNVVAQDWIDYEGYDDRPRDALAAEMANDVTEFLTKVLASEIRTKRLLKKSIVEWKIGGVWQQAVPLSPSNPAPRREGS